MKELYLIMGKLLEAEYNQKSLLYILETLESSYTEETHPEAKLIANCAANYIKIFLNELRNIINQIDNYIVEEADQK